MYRWSSVLGRAHAKPSAISKRKSNAKKSLRYSPRRNLLLESLEHRQMMAGDLWTQRGGDAGHTGYVDTSFDPAAFGRVWNKVLGYKLTGGTPDTHAVAIDESRVYRTVLEGYTFSGTYHVIAMDLATGEEVWHRTLVSGAHEGVGEPSVANGIVYVNRAGHSGISGGTDDDRPRLYGFDAETGELVLEQRYSAQWGSNERPAIADGQLVVEDGYYGGISAYDASTLTKQWFVGRSAAYDPPFAAVDDEYIYAFEDEIYRRSDGTRLPDLRHPTLARVADPIVSQSGRVITSVMDHPDYPRNFYISAFDGDTHGHQWTASIPDRPQGKAVGNGVIAVTAGNELLLLNEADGSQLMTWRSPDPLVSEIVLTQTHAFVQSTTGWLARVYAIDLTTGEMVWSHEQKVEYADQVMEMAFSGGHFVLSNQSFVRAFTAHLPVAKNDRATIDEDVILQIDVLANDRDGNGEALTLTAVSQASNGSVVINADDSVTYSPNKNFHGADSFTYTISDPSGDLATAVVEIVVTPVNDLPVVTDASFSIKRYPRNGSTVGVITASDVDGDRLRYSLVGEDAAGFRIDPYSGKIRVANASLIDFDAQRRYSFVVEITDGSGEVVTADVNVNPLVDPVRIRDIDVNDGSSQRSMVNSLRITFSGLVNVRNNAFRVTRRGVAIDLDVETENVNGRTVVTLTFPNTFYGGSLADGQYTLSIVGSRIRDQYGYQLDGNGDGREGGNAREEFFRLFGDIDGDGDVDRKDRSRFFAALGSRSGQSRYRWYMDYDGDGLINSMDRTQFLRRY